MKVLVDALNQRQRDLGELVSKVRDLDHPEIGGVAIQDLREAVELVGCLRRLVSGRTLEEIHKAFGAPGDFGYEHPIGDALYRLYRGES